MTEPSRDVRSGSTTDALSELSMLFCPACERDSFAETPPCPDGHGADCPDRACVDCGTALLLDAQLIQLLPARRSRRAA